MGTVSKKDASGPKHPIPRVIKLNLGMGWRKYSMLSSITQGKVDGDLLRIQVELKKYLEQGSLAYP